MNVILCSAFASLLLVLSSFAIANDDSEVEPLTPLNEIRVAVPAQMPPYFFLGEQGRPQGFAIDIFDAVASRAGIPYRYEILDSLPLTLEALRQRQIDVLPCIDLDCANGQWVRFTNPIVTIPVTAFVRADFMFEQQQGDLAGASIGILAVSYERKLRQKLEQLKAARVTRFDRIEVAFYALMSGEIDALVSDHPVVNRVAQNLQLSDRVLALDPPLMEVKHAIGVHADNEALRGRLDLALQAFVHSDNYHEIYQKWFGATPSFWSTASVF